MPYKEKPIVQRYFTIGEIAKPLGVKACTLRFWETEFVGHNLYYDKKNNDRRYTATNKDFIGLIFHYRKVEGHSLKVVRRKLREIHGIECHSLKELKS